MEQESLDDNTSVYNTIYWIIEAHHQYLPQQTGNSWRDGNTRPPYLHPEKTLEVLEKTLESPLDRKWKWSRSVVSDSLQPHGHQAPPSIGFSRQEYWSGLPFPSPDWASEQSLTILQFKKKRAISCTIWAASLEPRARSHPHCQKGSGHLYGSICRPNCHSAPGNRNNFSLILSQNPSLR